MIEIYKALGDFGYGVYIVASSDGNGKLNGQISNAVMQITAEPVTICAAVNKKNLTYEYIKKSNAFSVSTLKKNTPLTFIGTFGFKSGRDTDKFKGIGYMQGQVSPVVTGNAVSYVEAKVIQAVDVGTHTLFIGEVVAGGQISKTEPMTYDYYHNVLKAKTPQNASTYQKTPVLKEKNTQEEKMQKYICNVCGYIYDPAVGDPDNGQAAGTAFDALPDNWVCPVCGVPKSEFSPQ